MLRARRGEHWSFPLVYIASTVRARVVAEHRGLLEIAGIPGISFGLPRGVFADADDPLSRPAVGDFVQVLPQVGSDVALIEAIEPRKSVFVRRQVGRRARVQVVAANVDTVFVVMGLDGDFNPRRVLRYQVAIADAGPKRSSCSTSVISIRPAGRVKAWRAPWCACRRPTGGGSSSSRPGLVPGARWPSWALRG
jgi:hypothetical protein